MQAASPASGAAPTLAAPPAPVAKSSPAPVSEQAFKALELYASNRHEFLQKRRQDIGAHLEGLLPQIKAHARHKSLLDPFLVSWLFSEKNRLRLEAAQESIQESLNAQERTLSQIMLGDAPDFVAAIETIIDRKLARSPSGSPAARPASSSDAPEENQAQPDAHLLQTVEAIAERVNAVHTDAERRTVVRQQFPTLEQDYRAMGPSNDRLSPIGTRDQTIRSLLAILQLMSQQQ